MKRKSNIVKRMRKVMKSELKPCFCIELVLRMLKTFSFGFITHQNMWGLDNTYDGTHWRGASIGQS